MLLFFAAMFVMIEASAEVGMISMIGGWLESAIRATPEGSRLIVAIQILLWVSAVISGVLDNIPYTITMAGWVRPFALAAPAMPATALPACPALPPACMPGSAGGWMGRTCWLPAGWVLTAPPCHCCCASCRAAAAVPVIEYLAAAGLGLDLPVSWAAARLLWQGSRSRRRSSSKSLRWRRSPLHRQRWVGHLCS